MRSTLPSCVGAVSVVVGLWALVTSCGGRGATEVGGADAGGDDAGDQVDPIELCEAATTAEDCDAVRLPVLENCDDCGYACVWRTLYPTAYAAGGCSYGEPEGRCLYHRWGESGSDSLIRYCDAPFYSWGAVFWVDGDGERLFGFSPKDSVIANTHRCELDGRGQGSPAECACPCLPGYPAAECEQSGGVERCSGVPAHRIDDAACSDPGEHECTRDADCAPDEACLCAHGANEHERISLCVLAECRTDADCPEGLVCAVSYETLAQGAACEPTTLACRTPYTFCDGFVCDGNECVYDAADSSWHCEPGSCE